MFGFNLCKNLRVVGVSWNSSTRELKFLQNPSISSILPSLRYISTNKDSANENSLAVSYLINSFGLSRRSALSASKHVHFETLTQPDSVLSFLKNHGFSEAQITKIVKNYAKVLMGHPEETLLPKLEFFRSKGLSTSDIANILVTCPSLLNKSLEKHIIPSYNSLRHILHSDKNTVAAIKRCHVLLYHDFEKNMATKISFLRHKRVSESNILLLLLNSPRALTMSFDKIKKAVEEAIDMGFDPSKGRFAAAMRSLLSMSKSTWEKKVNAYKMWNLSEAEILGAFRKQPEFMTISEDKIMTVMDLFVNRLNWGPSSIANCPTLMTRSLEKRLIPRALVLQFLISKGLVTKNYRSSTIFLCPETSFLQKFVNCFDEAPELLKLYAEKLALQDAKGR